MFMLQHTGKLTYLRRHCSRCFIKYITRPIFSITGKWEDDFSIKTRKKVEETWKRRLQQYNEALTVGNNNKRPKYYVLSMFPYPSGKLHMGHVRVYTISDTMAHFHRMNGKQVLHPMGWDSFGLPAENAAIERGLRPDDWTFSNIEHMKDQLKSLSMCFNWERIDPPRIDPVNLKTSFKLGSCDWAVHRETIPSIFPRNSVFFNMHKSHVAHNIYRVSHLISALFTCIPNFQPKHIKEVTTCKPDYYRWTQSIFVRLFEAGLAYQKEALVNWDPVDQTVLANEQVDENGCSWRSGAKVEQKVLKQWYLKMTHYSKSLLDGLGDLKDWPENIKIMQANWIGDCSGCSFNFKLQIPGEDTTLSVHISNPELVFGVSYILLAPTHILLKSENLLQTLKPEVRKSLAEIDLEQVDVVLGVSAIHPFTQQAIPLVASSKHPFPAYVEQYAGVPGVIEEDQVFADEHSIKWTRVTGEDDKLVNSNEFTGMTRADAKEAIMKKARRHGIGGQMTSERQFDWLISRQRYWGTPIPIIHCENCKAVPVPRNQLPVQLPKLANLTGKGQSPLQQASEWYHTTCPKCGQPSRRETDTMDTFVDSAWYFLRYTDPYNEKEEFNSEVANSLMPVDLYIGGQEHAIMHLLYARFINHFLHSEGLLKHKEPFKRLLVQGLVMGPSYQLPSTGQYFTQEQIDFSGSVPVDKVTKEELAMKYEKMSKSKHNGVDPIESIAEYGIDTVRLFILSGVPPQHNMMWNIDAIVGIIRWKNRMWKLITRYIKLKEHSTSEANNSNNQNDKIIKEKNIAIKEVSEQYTKDYMLSVAISRLITFTNALRSVPDAAVPGVENEDALASLCVMLAPMAPHIASEMWQGLASVAAPSTKFQWNKSVLEQNWPVLQEIIQLKDKEIKVVIKINNKTKGHVKVPGHLRDDEAVIRKLVNESDVGKAYVNGRTLKKVVFASKVPLLNYIIEDEVS